MVRRINLDRHWNGKIDANDCGLTLPQICQKSAGAPIHLPACPFHHLSIPVVREAVNDQRSDLTKNALCQFTRSLGSKADIETVFASLPGDDFECIEPYGTVLEPDPLPKKVMGLVHEYDHWPVSEDALTRPYQERSPNPIRDEFARTVFV